MKNDKLLEQAELISSMLPRIMRRLFLFDADDPSLELPVAQLRVCGILRNGPHTMSALSKEFGISLSAITQIADRLERADLVERVAETDDRRIKRLQLTAHGAQMMHRRKEKIMQSLMKPLEQLSPESMDIVINALHILLEAGISATPDLVDDLLISTQFDG